jgi:GT2 family glycosyltransferase
MGRLGNLLFQIGSTIGLGKILNRIPMFEKNTNEYNTFFLKLFEKYPVIKAAPAPVLRGNTNLCNFYEFYDSKDQHIKVLGYLQSCLYTDPVKKELQDLLYPTEATLEKIFTKCPSFENMVAIHIRAGDYKSLSHIYTLLNVNYYKKATSYILEKNPNAKFIVFTDDFEYTLPIVSALDIDFMFADQSDLLNYEVLQWMSQFKSIIIGNSSFSWWGAYLGNADTVIAPLEWYSENPPSSWSDLYPADWILISNKDISIQFDFKVDVFWNGFSGNNPTVVITRDNAYIKKNGCGRTETVFLYTDAEDIPEKGAGIDYILCSKPFQTKYPDDAPVAWVGDINTVAGYKHLQNTVLTLLKKPDLTILIPVYNTKIEHLHTALISTFRQTYKKWEVLLLDDGSTNLDDFYSRNSFPGVLLIRCGKNYKLPTTLNRGIKMARTELLARMDSDDIMMEARLEKQIQFMNKHLNVAVNGCQLTTFYDVLDAARPVIMVPIVVQDMHWKTPRCLVAHPTAVYRKSVLKDIGYYSENAAHYEDLELWSRLYKKGYKLTSIPDNLFLYRIHSESVSKKNNYRQKKETDKIFKEMAGIYCK